MRGYASDTGFDTTASFDAIPDVPCPHFTMKCNSSTRHPGNVAISPSFYRGCLSRWYELPNNAQGFWHGLLHFQPLTEFFRLHLASNAVSKFPLVVWTWAFYVDCGSAASSSLVRKEIALWSAYVHCPTGHSSQTRTYAVICYMLLASNNNQVALRRCRVSPD